MGQSEKQYSKQKCRHCGNTTSMEVVANYSGVTTHTNYPNQPEFGWNEGPLYRLLLCPACEEVTLEKGYYHDALDDVPQIESVLYPQKNKEIHGLPTEVAKAFEAANKVQKIDPNAYAVLLRRVLDFVCEDRKASGNSLYERLSGLEKKGEIPKPLLEIAYKLKDFGNIGAHANLGELPKDVIPVLDDLCRAVLEYVYYGPYLVSVAKERMGKVGSRKGKIKKIQKSFGES